LDDDSSSAFSQTDAYWEEFTYLEGASASDSSTALSVPGGIRTPIEEQASCFFLRNFVLNPRTSVSGGWFDFLVPLMKSDSDETHLDIAFSAVSLASLANRPSSKGTGLMSKAVAQYAKALKALNLALQNPVTQKSDTTLASVLLLGFFEVRFPIF
jgi:hypothetical protein